MKKITKNHKKFVEGMKNGLSNDGSREFRDLRKAGLYDYWGSWYFTKKGLEVIRASYTVKSLYKKFYKTELGKSLFPEENKKRRAREEARTTKQTTPMKRLQEKRLERVRCLFDFPVQISQKNGDATYTSGYSLDWDGYSRRCKYPKKVWDNRLTIDTKRRTPLFKENDGIFNLTCLSRKKLENFIVELNEVAIKKQGYSLEIKKIYIAFLEDGSLSYHADSVKKAVTGLKNKLKRKVARQLKPSDKMTRAKYARITGACMFGIESFLKQKGLEHLTEITVAELLPLIKGQYGEKTILAAMEE